MPVRSCNEECTAMRNLDLVPCAGGPIALRASHSFATTEVRWFAEGALPASLIAWFTSERTSIELRRDRYRIDGSPDVGLKQRAGGPLEVKLRCPALGSVQLGRARVGRIEEWRKLTDVDEADLPVGPDPMWADVDKVVLTRTYRQSPDGAMQPITPRDLSAAGCDVELASVVVGEFVAWTFALETWGPERDRPAVLRDTLATFERETPFIDELVAGLGADVGYPEWLSMVVTDVRSATGT
jgi:hypothetical protein